MISAKEEREQALNSPNNYLYHTICKGIELAMKDGEMDFQYHTANKLTQIECNLLTVLGYEVSYNEDTFDYLITW